MDEWIGLMVFKFSLASDRHINVLLSSDAFSVNIDKNIFFMSSRPIPLHVPDHEIYTSV